MTSRIAKPGQTDQRKVYLNWANHQLRKLGGEGAPLSDLREVGDGLALPRVLKAVVQESVPGIHLAVTTDEDRRDNIEKCIRFLDKFGVNCSSFTTKDLCDGKDRAVLSLFYNLSQYKRAAPSNSAPTPSKSAPQAGTTPPTPGPTPSKSTPQPSRIARPISPGLKASHGVNNGSVVAPIAINSLHTSQNSLTASSNHSMSPPATSPISNSANKLTGPRRTAGSSIMTSTTFSHPYVQRKAPAKSASLEDEGEGVTKTLEVGDQNGDLVSSEVKSDPETDSPKQPRTTKLAKHSSFSFGHASSKESRFLKPGASKGTTSAEGAESATPPTQSKLKGPSGMSKLPGPKGKESSGEGSGGKEAGSSGAGSSGAGSGDAEDHAEPHRPPSRLKFPGSGRSTPSNSNWSGVQRPSSRLNKKGSNSINNLEGAGQEEEPGEKMRLQRKGSDGVIKRHLVLPLSKSGHMIPLGTSSLPRHLPKGTVRLVEATNADLSSSTEENDAAKSAHLNEGRDKSSPGKGEGVSGLKRPGLKKPGVSMISGVCTPNLPSSGPQTSTTTGEKDSGGGGAVNGHTPDSSPSLGKKLIAPKATGASKQALESRLKRCVSPSLRNKLHKVTPTPGLTRSQDTNEPTSGSKPLPSKVELDTELCSSSSSSSMESSEASSHTATAGQIKPVKPAGQVVKPVDKEEMEAKADSNSVESAQVTGNNTEDIVTSGQMEVESEGVAKEGEGHLRFGRRISPEGMSHEEISPKVEGNSQVMPPQSPVKDTESATNPEDQRSDDHTHQSRQSRYEDATSADVSAPPAVQRARSLSPKSPYRLVHKGMSRVRDLEGGVGGALIRVNSSESTSSEGMPAPSSARKPLKSSLRCKGRHSSSSTEGVVSPVPRQPKVTISPRSSQMVYDPDSGVHIPPSGQFYSPNFLSPGGVASDRPISFASIDSSTTSGSLSPSSSSHALYMRGGGVARHASLRSTMSDQVEYHGEQQYADMAVSPSEGVGSGLIESFENQLTNMKAELTDKDRMLSMYENSMADLNSKMHLLKKSIEEKDNAIQHLTEKQSWYDLDGNSLMLGRAASADHEALSDGYLSDSTMDEGKEKNKKKKAWKFPFHKKKKDTDGLHMEHLSPNMDTESVISSRTAKSLKRSLGKKKTPDLMSISEYPPELESRYKDIDTKSTYTMDARSEYGGGLLPLWEEDPVIVYDDPEPGARAEVILFIDTNEGTKAPANDSGYYGDLFGRHGISSSKWGRESVGSSDSGNHGDDGTEQFILGTLSISPEISWVSMDSKVADIFHHHINTIDSERSLGLKEDSIYCYLVGEEHRQMGNALLPPITPHEALGNKLTIKIYMKGAGQQSCDSLAYKTLMGVESLRSYIGILQETQWLVIMGTKGTCKSSLVSGLAQHLSSSLEAEEGEGMEDLVVGVSGGEIIRFNLDKDGLTKILKYFKADLVKRVQLQLHPPIVVLEDIYECKDLEQLLVAASALSRRPYIIASLSSGTTKGVPLHQLMFHHQIRLVTCNPQTDPVVGILGRSLRKQIYQVKATAQSLDPVAERLVNWVPYLLNHLNNFINKFHSNVVNLGPRVFMACPLNNSTNELETWFLSLWNHFIIPYLMGTIMAGIETYTADPMLEWVDVREWVVETYPWPNAINVNKLRTLSPEDVGWNHAVRPHQNRYIVVKDDKSPDDIRSILRHETQSLIH